MERFRGRVVFLSQKASHSGGDEENITDGYPSSRMHDAEEKMKETGTRYKPRTSVISIADAVKFAKSPEDEAHAKLSETQKHVVEIVAEKMKTDEGAFLLNDAASRGIYIVAVGQVGYRIGGRESGNKGLVTLGMLGDNGSKRSMKELRQNAHHELTHSYQSGHTEMPEHLSSRGEALWKIGKEGQAYVAAANDESIAEGKGPLSDQQRAKVFVEHTSDKFYSKYYHLDKSDDSNGDPLKLSDFQKTFGALPGEKGGRNFLENGPAVNSVNDYLNKSMLRAKPAVALAAPK